MNFNKDKIYKNKTVIHNKKLKNRKNDSLHLLKHIYYVFFLLKFIYKFKISEFPDLAAKCKADLLFLSVLFISFSKSYSSNSSYNIINSPTISGYSQIHAKCSIVYPKSGMITLLKDKSLCSINIFNYSRLLFLIYPIISLL